MNAMNAPAFSFSAALPELFLSLSGLALLLFGALTGEKSYRRVAALALIALLVAAVLVLFGAGARSVEFGGLFVVDGFGAFMKALVLLIKPTKMLDCWAISRRA